MRATRGSVDTSNSSDRNCSTKISRRNYCSVYVHTSMADDGPGDDCVLQREREPGVLGADGEAGNRRRTNNMRK